MKSDLKTTVQVRINRNVADQLLRAESGAMMSTNQAKHGASPEIIVSLPAACRGHGTTKTWSPCLSSQRDQTTEVCTQKLQHLCTVRHKEKLDSLVEPFPQSSPLGQVARVRLTL